MFALLLVLLAVNDPNLTYPSDGNMVYENPNLVVPPYKSALDLNSPYGYGFAGSHLNIATNSVAGIYFKGYDSNWSVAQQPSNPYCLLWLTKQYGGTMVIAGSDERALFTCDETCVKETCECHATKCVRQAIIRSTLRSDHKK